MRRTRRLGAALLAGGIAAALLVSSCVSSVTPPFSPEKPCRVFVVDDALHTGMVLPDFESGYIEYGFGDWDWYARLRNRWYNVFDTILWPTQGCLGRRILDASAVDREVTAGRLTPLEVDAAAAQALLEDLDRAFGAAISTLVRNRNYGMDFVAVEEGFWFWHNCSDATAQWLRCLGCRVAPALVRTGLSIAGP